MSTLRLGVNIDHIATLRQARYASMPESQNAEPDPITIASICEHTGAHGITAHLRADRRHIQTRDIERLRANIMTKLNLEMGNTPEIVDVALRIVPDEVCLVPEKREEITTEGGLDLIAHRRELGPTVKRLHAAGIRVSMFIDPVDKQIDAAVELEADIVELHTGKLANAFTEKFAKQELERLREAALARGKSKIAGKRGTRNQLPQHRAHPQNPAPHGAEHRAFDCGAFRLCRLRNGRARNARRDGELQGMSVLGIGVDMVETARIQHSLERFGERFLHRVFTQGEIDYCNQ